MPGRGRAIRGVHQPCSSILCKQKEPEEVRASMPPHPYTHACSGDPQASSGVRKCGSQKGRGRGRLEHPWENEKGEYDIIGVLGSGAYGTVHSATHRATGATVAIKKIVVALGEEGVPQSVIREVAALKLVGDHPNIARLLDVQHGLRNAGELYIHLIFERCDWDLYAFLQNIPSKLPEGQVRYFAKQILVGLDFLHSKKVVHRDLKPQNILVNLDGTVKLTDFGLARAFTGSALTPVVVTLWYRSPELILQCDYNSVVDIWSAACIIGEMYTRTPVFAGQTEREQLALIFQALGLPDARDWPSEARVTRENFPPTQPHPLDKLISGASAEAYAVLQAMFTYNIMERPSAKQLLLFPYFTGFTVIPTFPAMTAVFHAPLN